MALEGTILPKMPIIDSRHPNFISQIADFEKWRITYRGGEEFKIRYLEKFSNRETQPEYQSRLDRTPVPTFAKAAINDIRNSIFQRMRDIIRVGGSDDYQHAIAGDDFGVDRRGRNMNAFLGMQCLTELLVMGRVGVFVDNTKPNGPTLADARMSRPYLYSYQSEDILSWTCNKPEDPSEFQSILLRDSCLDYDPRTLLPTQSYQRYRLMWVDQNTGRVNLQFYDYTGNEITPDGQPGGLPIETELTRIPFVLLDIGDSLIKDVASYQIALLNLVSSDVNYCCKASFPFITQQRDMRAIGGHLKPAANADGTATAGGQGASDTDVKVGVSQGVYYDLKTDRPGYIHPSSEPLRASMDLQVKLEGDIRKLVNLAVVNLATRSSAESKSMDNQGLEAGLSFIGLVLEAAERRIAEFWAAYEERTPVKRQIATIKYPDRYSLKTDLDRIAEATKLSELMFTVPGTTVKREIAKTITTTLLGGKVDVDTLDTISKEIDSADYTTSDPKTIIAAQQAGLVSEDTASQALGFKQGEYLKAREDHTARIIRIAEAQAEGNPQMGTDPAARGVRDLSANPASAGKQEKAQSRDTTMSDSTASRVRGQAKFGKVK